VPTAKAGDATNPAMVTTKVPRLRLTRFNAARDFIWLQKEVLLGIKKKQIKNMCI
jgi:hypothetical protein